MYIKYLYIYIFLFLNFYRKWFKFDLEYILFKLVKIIFLRNVYLLGIMIKIFDFLGLMKENR